MNQKYSRFQTRRRALCCLKRSYRKSRKVSVLWFTVDVFDLTDVFKSSFCLCAGKVGSEDEVKEEFKEESDPPATHEEGSLLLHSLFISSTHPFLFPFPLSLSFLLIESRLLKPASLHHFFSFWIVLPLAWSSAWLTLVICVSFSKVWVPVWLARILRGMDRRKRFALFQSSSLSSVQTSSLPEASVDSLQRPLTMCVFRSVFLSLSFFLFCLFLCVLCTLAYVIILCVYEAWHVGGLLGQVCWAAAALYAFEIHCTFTSFSEIYSNKV